MQILSFIITLILTCSAFISAGQNKLTRNDLMIGMWLHEYEERSEKYSETGMYKVIPINTYDTLSPFGNGYHKVKYKGSSPLLFYSGRHEDNISVRDSLWQTFNSSGKLCNAQFWQLGLKLWTKYYDDEGNLIQHDYNDFENDTNFYQSYINKQLFKKEFYPPENKNQSFAIFYPDNNLVISNAEPTFYSKFGDLAVNIFQLELSCKQNLSIQSISSSSGNIQINFPFKSLPFKLTPKDTAYIDLVFTPTPTSFRTSDTITVVTSELNTPPYKIYCYLNATHIDGSNVETLTEISLSKSKDRYLLVSPMGTQTDVFITDTKGEKKQFGIYGITKIDLNELNVGDYDMAIFSCNTGGKMLLKITE